MHLILFFTYGVSLKTWAETGLLDREILIYKKLSQKGIKVSFITYGDESDNHYKDKLGDIELLPSYSFTRRPSIKIIRLIHSSFLPIVLRKKIKKADLLKTNQMSGSWVAVLAKLLYGKKLIIRCGFEWHRFTIQECASSLIRLFVYVIEWISYHIANAIIVTSENDRQYIINNFRIRSKDKIRVFNNYIDTNVFKPTHNSKKKKHHLLYVGRLSRQKNLFNLLQAIKATKYTLDIIGDGELKDDLLTYSRRDQIKVNFLGQFPNHEIPNLLNQYEIFILPSFYEGNPKTLLEAMSCELAVIGTDVEGINNIIRHMENGYLCRTDNKSIRQAVDTVRGDALLRRHMREAARKYIIQNFNLEEILKEEKRFYSEILHAKII